jgi:hypothetical protein
MSALRPIFPQSLQKYRAAITDAMCQKAENSQTGTQPALEADQFQYPLMGWSGRAPAPPAF